MNVLAPAAHSLKWRLVRRLLALQAVMLSLLVVLLLGALYLGGYLLNFESEDVIVDAMRSAVERNADGGLSLRATPDLMRLRDEVPGLWFILRDRQGHRLVEGSPPPHFARIGDALDDIGNARFGWNLGDPPRAGAQVRWIQSPAGEVQVMTGPGAMAPASWLAKGLLIVFATFVLPALAVMAFATLTATPLVVSKALSGLGEVAKEAEQINIDRQGARLSTAFTPSEVTPLVDAINRALERIDEGHARHKRFLADAAHELRTPVAILQTRLEALPASPERIRLLEDVARLSTMAEQLLDLQRIERNRAAFASLELVGLAQRVIADLAPLAIAAGYEIAFEAEADRIDAWGDQGALERALANLIQNAIQHGGRAGTITITAGAARTIDVADEGPGIPPDQRERIFEPFSRVSQAERGAGLGLHLVRETVRLHGGEVTLCEVPQGACFRISLPDPGVMLG